MAQRLTAEPNTFDWVFAISNGAVTRLAVAKVAEDDLRPHLTPGVIYRIVAVTKRPRASLTIWCTVDSNSGALVHAPNDICHPDEERSDDQDLVFACITDSNEAVGLESSYWSLSGYLARALPNWPTIDALEAALSKCLRTALHRTAWTHAKERYIQLQAMWRTGELAAVVSDDYLAMLAAWPRPCGEIASPISPSIVTGMILLAAFTAHLGLIGVALSVVILTSIGLDKMKWRRLRRSAVERVMSSPTLLQFLHERHAVQLRIVSTGQPVDAE